MVKSTSKFNLDVFMNSTTGKIIISLIIGLGLGTLFKKVCKDHNCIKYIAPTDPNYITSQVYTHNGKCYNFITETTKCREDAIK